MSKPATTSPSGAFLALVGQQHETWLRDLLERYRGMGETHARALLQARNAAWRLCLSAEQIETAARGLAPIARDAVARVLAELFHVHVLTEDQMRADADRVTAVCEVCPRCGSTIDRTRTRRAQPK